MKYLANLDNLVRTADLTATGFVASAVVHRTDSDPKVGGGQVQLAGGYTGAADATYEIEIVDTAATNPVVSQPLFAGVGNGTMTGVTVAGIGAQQFTVTLEDLGTPTRAAYAPFEGVNLEARAAGAGGNAITLAIDTSGLTATATSFALQAPLRAGTNQYSGDQWNFGAATLNPDGTIPDSAPRLRFGIDPQVYRAYRYYEAGQYVYAFSPAPVRDVPQGAAVLAISGSRTVTITDGTTTDTLTAIITVYDCLSAIRAGSTLVQVDGAIVNDKTPGGQGVTELASATSSYLLSLTGSGSDFAKTADIGLTVAAAAPTETLTIRCTSATTSGAEQWSVKGDVSGVLDPAVTGVAYADGPYAFTIPEQTLPPAPAGATITVQFIPVTRGDGEQMPNVSIVNAVLGVAAANGTLDFVYSARPPAPCTDAGAVSGSPSSACLGLSPPSTIGGGSVSGDSYLRRYQRLADEVLALTAPNVTSFQIALDANLEWIQTSANILKQCLDSLQSGTLVLDAWEASTAYALDDMRSPTVANGYRYAVTTAGTSGATEPAWGTTVDGATSDGSVVWTCIGKTPWLMWDDVFADWKTKVARLSVGAGTHTPQWMPSWDVSAATPANIARPTIVNRNGNTYFVSRVVNRTAIYSGSTIIGYATYTGSTEPTWPTAPNTEVVDNDVAWMLADSYWLASTAYTTGTQITDGAGTIWNSRSPGGTSGTAEPNFYEPGANGIADGTVTWDKVGGSVLTGDTPSDAFDDLRAACTDVLAAAGIDANFEAASAEGDGCWHDHGDANWWVYQGQTPYLPVFNNVYYHSTIETQNDDGKPVYESTKEFGFGPRVGCPDLLKYGDVLRVIINGVDGVSGRMYQVGDEFDATIVHATPVEFGGGQIGNDTLTWSVFGSVAGRLDDYALLTTAPAAYSDAGLGFLITPGGIPFALGDAFTFSVEGGRYHWRRNGGAWSATVDVTPTAVIDAGLTATFVPGVAPSWAANDKWTFRAEAVNGPDGLRQPTDARMTWTGSTTIDVDPGAPSTIAGVFIGDHTIPATATITLQGSDDGFATTPLDETVAWSATHIWHPVAASHAAYRLLVDQDGSIQWLYLGVPFQPTLRTGIVELGALVKKWRLPGPVTRRALGCTVTHSGMANDAANGLIDRLAHAAEYDERRLGLIPNDAETEASIAILNGDPVELDDELTFQPRATADRLVSVQMQFDPAP